MSSSQLMLDLSNYELTASDIAQRYTDEDIDTFKEKIKGWA